MRVEEIKQEEKVSVKEAKTTKKKVGIVPTIHIIHILDGSASMSGARFQAAKEGMHEELTAIKEEKDKVNYTYSVVEFDYSERIKIALDKGDPKKVTINDIELFAPSGMTALYDAIGKTLSDFKYKKEDKVIVKIFTDGGENNSKNFSGSKVKELIQSKEKEGWVITFVGTPQDTKNIINNLGVNMSNTLTYDGSAEGLRSAYTVSNMSRQSYAKSVIKGDATNTNFFSK